MPGLPPAEGDYYDPGWASGQPPAARRALTLATSSSEGNSWVTPLIAIRIACASAGAFDTASSSAIAETSSDLKRLLSELFPGGERAENLFVRDLMLSALTSGSARRIRFAPLAKRDIVCYLPHQRFLSTGSWDDDETAFDEAYAAAEARRAAGSTEKLPVFKSWLTENRGADFGDDAVLAAVETMDAVHDDLLRLVSAIADPG